MRIATWVSCRVTWPDGKEDGGDEDESQFEFGDLDVVSGDLVGWDGSKCEAKEDGGDGGIKYEAGWTIVEGRLGGRKRGWRVTLATS